MAYPPTRSVPDWLAYPAAILGIVASSLAIGRYFHSNRQTIVTLVKTNRRKVSIGSIFPLLGIGIYSSLLPKSFESAVLMYLVVGSITTICIIDSFFAHRRPIAPAALK